MLEVYRRLRCRGASGVWFTAGFDGAGAMRARPCGCVSGWSVKNRWFASGIIVSSAPGTFAAMRRPFSAGTNRSPRHAGRVWARARWAAAPGRPARGALNLREVTSRRTGQGQAHRPVLLDALSGRSDGVVERDRGLSRVLRCHIRTLSQKREGLRVPHGVGDTRVGAAQHRRAHLVRHRDRELLREQTAHRRADHGS